MIYEIVRFSASIVVCMCVCVHIYDTHIGAVTWFGGAIALSFFRDGPWVGLVFGIQPGFSLSASLNYSSPTRTHIFFFEITEFTWGKYNIYLYRPFFVNWEYKFY